MIFFENFWIRQLNQSNFDYPQMPKQQKGIFVTFKRSCPKMPKLSKRATLIKEYESIAASQAVKAYVCFCFDDEDSFEDDIDYCISAELAVLKSSQYLFLD